MPIMGYTLLFFFCNAKLVKISNKEHGKILFLHRAFPFSYRVFHNHFFLFLNPFSQFHFIPLLRFLNDTRYILSICLFRLTFLPSASPRS